MDLDLHCDEYLPVIYWCDNKLAVRGRDDEKYPDVKFLNHLDWKKPAFQQAIHDFVVEDMCKIIEYQEESLCDTIIYSMNPVLLCMEPDHCLATYNIFAKQSRMGETRHILYHVFIQNCTIEIKKIYTCIYHDY